MMEMNEDVDVEVRTDFDWWEASGGFEERD